MESNITTRKSIITILMLLQIFVTVTSCNNSKQTDNFNENAETKVINSEKEQGNYKVIRNKKFVVLNHLNNSPENSNLTEILVNQLNNATTDYISKKKEGPLLNHTNASGLNIISPAGNIIYRTDTLTLVEIEKIKSKIALSDSFYTAYSINIETLKSFPPKFTSIEGKKNFFEAGVFDNYIIPQQFTENGRFSVIVHSLPGCPPCKSIKKELLSDECLPGDVDFYFLNHAYDCEDIQHSQTELNNSTVFKTYIADGIRCFPTIWFIDDNGYIIKIYDASSIEKQNISFFENIKEYILKNMFTR